MDLNHFKQKFIEEAYGLLVNLDNVLIELEKDPHNAPLINEAFRAMHTIKGAGGMYGFDHVVEITHNIESLFDVIRQNKSPISQSLIEVTFSSADHIRELLNDEALENIQNITRHKQLNNAISVVREQITGTSQTAEIPTQNKIAEKSAKLCTWNILFYPNDDIIRRAINLIYTFQDLFLLGEYKISNTPYNSNNEQFWSIFLVTNQPYDEIEGALLFVMDHCKITKIADFNIFNADELAFRNSTLTNKMANEPEKPHFIDPTPKLEPINELFEEIQAPIIKESSLTSPEKHTTSRVNVDASKLDQLMYLVSELVTTKSELLLALERQNYTKVSDAAEKIEKLSNLFSENALSIRLVSLNEMLSRFKRLVRDLSKQLNKSVAFVTVGDDTELDKNIIDKIGEPVMHLIRNCIDHGIESPEKRKSTGKPETGSIKIEAIKSGNNVFLTISDDGNGIDLNFVRSKAIENGFINANSNLTEKEILDLIFLPGFSTAQSLTNISGRGVGMDIVKKKIQEIRGEISINTIKGKGTSFVLKLQQTVSIIETLLIEAEGQTYALPIEDIEACILEPTENFTDRISRQIGYNGQLIPYISLRETLCNVSRNAEITEKIVIIKRAGKVYAIVVDNIIGEYQAVIKPLGEAFSKLNFLSGASLLGDGSIALLLDTDKLWFEISAKSYN